MCLNYTYIHVYVLDDSVFDVFKLYMLDDRVTNLLLLFVIYFVDITRYWNC